MEAGYKFYFMQSVQLPTLQIIQFQSKLIPSYANKPLTRSRKKRINNSRVESKVPATPKFAKVIQK